MEFKYINNEGDITIEASNGVSFGGDENPDNNSIDLYFQNAISEDESTLIQDFERTAKLLNAFNALMIQIVKHDVVVNSHCDDGCITIEFGIPEFEEIFGEGGES